MSAGSELSGEEIPKSRGKQVELSFGHELKPKRQSGTKRIWIKYGQKFVTGKSSAFQGWTTQCRYYRCFMKDCPAKRHVLIPLTATKEGKKNEKAPDVKVKATQPAPPCDDAPSDPASAVLAGVRRA